jgi:DNA-binding NtrC family response regulator
VSQVERLTSPERAIPEEGLNFDAIVTEVERDLLLQSLTKSGGNKMRAAKLLNMKRTTFVEKLKRLQIDSEMSDEV